MRSPRSRSVAAFLALLPVIGEWIWKFAVKPRPFWVHYYDPETAYFYEGLRIAAGRVPNNVDNPGVPVHLVSAAVAFFTGRTPLTYATFIAAAHIFELLLTVGGAWLLVTTLLRDAPPLAVVTAIWTWFMAPQALEYLFVWSPEGFFFGLGVVALAAIAASLSSPRDARRDALAGAGIGLLVATKFLFGVWGVALCIAYFAARDRPLRRCATAAVAAIAAFLIGTCVAAPRYGSMVSWLFRLAANSGTYGTGRRELPHLAEVIAGYSHQMLTARGWLLWLAIVAALGVATFLRGSKALRPLLVFAFTAAAISVTIAMRAPQFRYLFPVALCAVLIVASSADLLRAHRSAAIAVTIVAGLLLAKAIAGDVRDHRARIDSLVALHDEVAAEVNRIAPGGVVLYGWRFPTPSFALRVNASREVELAEIASRYPREGHYDDWRRRVVLPPGATRWDVLVIDESLLSEFPQPVGPTVARFGTFRLVLPPAR